MSDVVSGLNVAPGFTAIGEITLDAVRSAGWRSAPTAHVLMITHYGDDSVSLIDTADGAVALTVIDVEESFAVAMSGNRAYVSSVSTEHDAMLAFDTESERDRRGPTR